MAYHLARSDFGGRHFETVMVATGSVYVTTSFCTTWNWWEGEKPATDLASFTRSAKSIFFKWLSTSLSSLFWSQQHFWLKIIWLKSSHSPEWWLKSLSENSGQNFGNDITKTRPGCWVLFKMVATMFEFRSFVETMFIKKNRTLQAGEWLNLMQSFFISVNKRL